MGSCGHFLNLANNSLKIKPHEKQLTQCLCLIFFLGLCLEKLPVSSSTSNLHADREQEVITCYEKAGDIALLYLQEIERVSEDRAFVPVDT